LDWLIGPYPQAREVYHQRSPIHFADLISSPIIFFQGEEDAVVPPEQTALMAETLQARGIPYACLLFAGEQHGFRRAETVKRALDAELYFYGIHLLRQTLRFLERPMGRFTSLVLSNAWRNRRRTLPTIGTNAGC